VSAGTEALYAKRTCRREDFLCRTEPVGVVHGDGKPDEAEEKVEHYDEEREAEHGLVPLRREVVDRD
jgi:hypothetical protein